MSTTQDKLGGADRPTQPDATMARTSRSGSGGPPPPPRRRDRRAAAEAAKASQHRRQWRIGRRIAAFALFALLVPTVWSYYQQVSAPGTDPVTVRSVEWLKDNGMTGVVNSVEHWWYTHHAPPVGGKLKHGIPHSSGVSGTAQGKKGSGPAIPAHLSPPAPIPPLVTTPLAGEGIWTATGRTVQGLPSVYTTYFRPDELHTSIVVAAMWIDTTLLKAQLVPGLQEPGGPNPWGGMVPLDQRPGLVAAFNSGFKVQDSLGGYFGFGQQVHPLANGVASLVIDTNGKPSVGLWGRDFVLGPNIATVRQNLSLLVDNGQLPAGLTSDSNIKWGATVGNNVYVWRSGVGVTANGALVYVAGNGLSVPSLAILLQRAGAVRAMELDINSSWVSAYTFQGTDPANPAAVTGVKLLPGMQRGGDRYLVPGERDFFAFFAAH